MQFRDPVALLLLREVREDAYSVDQVEGAIGKRCGRISSDGTPVAGEMSRTPADRALVNVHAAHVEAGQEGGHVPRHPSAAAAEVENVPERRALAVSRCSVDELPRRPSPNGHERAAVAAAGDMEAQPRWRQTAAAEHVRHEVAQAARQLRPRNPQGAAGGAGEDAAGDVSDERQADSFSQSPSGASMARARPPSDPMKTGSSMYFTLPPPTWPSASSRALLRLRMRPPPPERMMLLRTRSWNSGSTRESRSSMVSMVGGSSVSQAAFNSGVMSSSVGTPFTGAVTITLSGTSPTKLCFSFHSRTM